MGKVPGVVGAPSAAYNNIIAGNDNNIKHKHNKRNNNNNVNNSNSIDAVTYMASEWTFLL